MWKELSSLVMENHVDVILGFVLEENGKLWNAAACLCEDGSRHYYRKSHLTEREAQWAEAETVPDWSLIALMAESVYC